MADALEGPVDPSGKDLLDGRRAVDALAHLHEVGGSELPGGFLLGGDGVDGDDPPGVAQP